MRLTVAGSCGSARGVPHVAVAGVKEDTSTRVGSFRVVQPKSTRGNAYSYTHTGMAKKTAGRLKH